MRTLVSILAFVCLCATTFLTGCTACPNVTRLDTRSTPPALVEIVLSVQCRGEPVTTISASDVTLYEGGTEVDRAESPWTVTPAPDALSLSTLILVDVSASLVDDEETNLALHDSAVALSVELLAGNQEVAIAIFDGDPDVRTLQDFSTDPDALEDAIRGIDASDRVDPSTNLNGGVLQALDILDAAVEPVDSDDLLGIGSLVIVTDGVDRAGRETDSAARGAVNRSDNEVYVLALVGDEAAEELEPLASTAFFQPANAAALDDSFESLRDTLIDEFEKHYVLSYCSPLRSPRTTLRVEVLHEDKKSSIKFEYPTGEFGPGCELPQ